MLERPDAGELIEAARETVLNSLLAALPREKHYEARMVANALAIAGRALNAAVPAHDIARLASALRQDAPAPGSAAYAETRAALEEIARARCAVSAPKAL